MPKKPKEHKPKSRAAINLHRLIAENVQWLMRNRFPEKRFKTQSGQEKKLAAEAGCKWSTIQRILGSIKGTPENELVFSTVATLADVALALGVKPMELLTPNLAYRDVSTDALAESRELHRPSGA